ncbi:hypothetical protein D3C73_862580 [compost metagenome]
MSNDTLALGGTFDGRYFIITNNVISSLGQGNLTTSITLQPVKGHTGKELVVFKLSKGTGNTEVPVQIIASHQDIVGDTDITQSFDNVSGTLSDYTVTAYIFDSTTGLKVLGQEVTMKLQ